MRLDVNQLAQELDLQSGTLRSWLCNYRFNKNRLTGKPMSFKVTKDFLTCLEGYICLKGTTPKVLHTIHRLRWLRSRVNE